MDKAGVKKPPGSPSIRKVGGNLRFPLDTTYHGCPQITFPQITFVILIGIMSPNFLGTQEQPGATVRYAVREDYRRFDKKRNLIYKGE